MSCSLEACLAHNSSVGLLFRLLAVVSCYSIFLLTNLKMLKNDLIGECSKCGKFFLTIIIEL